MSLFLNLALAQVWCRLVLHKSAIYQIPRSLLTFPQLRTERLLPRALNARKSQHLKLFGALALLGCTKLEPEPIYEHALTVGAQKQLFPRLC